jgi:glycine/D-amino acid oxidase-like deaminating enzyme
MSDGKDAQLQLPKVQSSYWLKGFLQEAYAPLAHDVEVDVAIIGGGIAGLTTAYLLKQAGLTVAVLEKQTIGHGTTGGTTGKVTTQHGLIYDELISRWGVQGAQVYATACDKALQKIAAVIKQEHIACEWRQEDNYVYTNDSARISKFKKEAEAATKLGLPASFEADLDLPFPTQGAVKFAKQGTFHVLKYLSGLAKAVHGEGSYIFEHSNVQAIHEGSPGKLRTEQASVSAKSIVVATKVPTGPLLARATYAANEYPQTSYIVAGKNNSKLKGMYISPDKGHYSLLPIKSDEGPLLLIGGQNHIPGLGKSAKRQQLLADYGQQWFGFTEIAYRWKAMDYIAYDKLPFAGPLYPQSQNLYFIGGFKKWGLNLSMAAATVIHDHIIGIENPARKLFRPNRLSAPASIPKTMLEYLR